MAGGRVGLGVTGGTRCESEDPVRGPKDAAEDDLCEPSAAGLPRGLERHPDGLDPAQSAP